MVIARGDKRRWYFRVTEDTRIWIDHSDSMNESGWHIGKKGNGLHFF